MTYEIFYAPFTLEEVKAAIHISCVFPANGKVTVK